MIYQPRGRNLDVLLAERRARRRSILLNTLAGVLALAGIIYLIKVWYDQRRVPDDTEHRVVIAPFDNRTGDRALDDLGLITSDWITNGLSRFAPRYQVVPTTTVLAYKHSARVSRFDPYTGARVLAGGTRAHILVHGSYYYARDSLRFHFSIHDLNADTAWTQWKDVAAPAHDVMRGVDLVRRMVAERILSTVWEGRLRGARVPEFEQYAAFVRGLDAYARREYTQAAEHFARADGAPTLQVLSWHMDALARGKQFERADSLARSWRRHYFTPEGRARLAHGWARINGNTWNAYVASLMLARANPADDAARFDHALDALAVGHPREARRIFSELYPNRGSLHGRPEYWLHFAAAYHMLGNHRSEMRVVRDGQRARERALEVRLAYCRVRAAGKDREAALSALNAITWADVDTAFASISVPVALRDCAAELEAHGHVDLASLAQQKANVWSRNARRSEPDSAHDRGFTWYREAQLEAAAGRLDEAVKALRAALDNGYPLYRRGHVMLHADPSLRPLWSTREFKALVKPRG